MRERVICVGTVRTNSYWQRGQRGTPGCLAICWQGRTGVFQPWDFLDWEDLWWAIQRRCLLAGLEASEPRCLWPARQVRDHREMDLLVRVTRAQDRYWKRLERETVNPKWDSRELVPPKELVPPRIEN